MTVLAQNQEVASCWIVRRGGTAGVACLGRGSVRPGPGVTGGTRRFVAGFVRAKSVEWAPGRAQTGLQCCLLLRGCVLKADAAGGRILPMRNAAAGLLCAMVEQLVLWLERSIPAFRVAWC